MGTRNLTMIRLGGKLKLAHYGQWDGYPTGQGAEVAAFVQAHLLHATLRAEFCEQVAKLKFATDAELQTLQDERDALEADTRARHKADQYVSKHSEKRFVAFDRDTGATILNLIREGLECRLVKDDRAFLEDTLFCEWAYLVDLDACTVEVFQSTTAPVATIPFSEFTVYSMRDLETVLRKLAGPGDDIHDVRKGG